MTTNCGGGGYILDGSTELTRVSATGNVSAKGGVLYLSSKSDTTVTDCEFDQNAADTYGGAVYASGATTASFNNVKFNGNSASSTKSSTPCGGAIYIVSCGVDVQNCSFEGNTSASRGGAIYLEKTEDKDDGSKTAAATVSVQNTTFTGNKARNGGAINAWNDAEITLTDVTFDSNSALGTESDTDARGGAIYVIKAKVVATNVQFTSNHADKYGGAIDAHTDADVTLTNVTLTQNSANGNGGAIWAYTNTNIVITGLTATQNSSDDYGGFAYTRGQLTVAPMEDGQVVFASNTSGSRGGAIAAGASSVVTVTGARFSENSGTGGGAIYCLATVNVADSLFENNTATGHGGAINVSDGTLTSLNCSFSNNVASGNGGAVFVAENSAYIDGVVAEQPATEGEQEQTALGSTFVGNKAASGGAIYSSAVEDPEADPDHVAGMITVDGSAFLQNAATASGGAIYVGKGSILIDGGSEYIENAAYQGGAIFMALESPVINEFKAKITGSTFDSNTATNTESESKARGGAIYVGEYLTVYLTDCVFKNNSAQQYGGAVSAARGANINAQGCEFDGNEATTNGGALWLYSDGSGTVTDSTFTNNKCGTNGGAIFTYVPLTATNTSFSNNTAASGAAIYASGDTAVITADSCTFNANEVTGNGGAIALVSEASLIDNGSTYTANKAIYGGAICIGVDDKGKVCSATVTNSVFDGNVAENRGGAIYATDAATLTVTGGEMKNNTVNGETSSTSYGGALDIRAGSVATVTNTVISANSAYSGGAISSYGKGTLVTLNGVELAENVGSNGAIYIGSAGAVAVTDLNAHDNATKTNGAIFYLTSGAATTLTVNSATLSNNTAKGSLGFIVINNASNVLNINKSAVTGSDVNDNWDVLIKNSKGATVNELTDAE